MQLLLRITTWYPSFGFNCHLLGGDTIAFTIMFVLSLVSELIMAYYTIKACIKAITADHVSAKGSTLAKLKALILNKRTGDDSLTKRVATSAFGDSVWLFFVAIIFDIFGALWVLFFFIIWNDPKRGVT